MRFSLQRLARRMRYLSGRTRADADLAEEMEFHRAMLRESAGLDGQEARRAMGNTSMSREDARAVWVWPWLETIFQDLGYAARGFLRQPGFTAVAVVALGCAIGLNTSLFTVFSALALRPWPVAQPSRIGRF